MDYCIGVDGGGSRTRLVVTDASGKIIARGESGRCNLRLGSEHCWRSIFEALENACGHAEKKSMHAAMGLAGTEDSSALTEFLSHAHPFERLIVVSDAQAACLGAHGSQEGAVIIAGTGVIGYQRSGDQSDRVSGFGFHYDDQGSGAWLGMQVCQWVLRIQDQRESRKSVLVSALLEKHAGFDGFLKWMYAAKPADFARLVSLIVSFQDQDELAKELLESAARHLEIIHQALLLKQRDRGVLLPCALMGGLSEVLKPYLSENMQAALVDAKTSPEEGVLRLLRI